MISIITALMISNTMALGSEPWFVPDAEGWGERVSQINTQLSENKNYLVFFVFTPGFVIDMRSAEHLRESMEYSGFSGAISHIAVGWQCHDSKGAVYRKITGQSGEHKDQTMSMVLSGWGLTPFFSVFTDGDMETVWHFNNKRLLDILTAETDKSPHLKSGPNVTYYPVAIEVSQAACSDLVHFVYDYTHLPSQPYKNFGLVVDPAKFEGGGCGSFAAAAIEKTHIMDEITPFFRRTLRTSWDMIGYRSSPPDDTKPFVPTAVSKHSVAVSSFMRSSWDDPTGQGPSVTLVDPEMVLFFIRTMQEAIAQARPELGVHPIRRVAARYIPEGDLDVMGTFLHEYSGSEEISEQFDLQTHNLYLQTWAWWTRLQQHGYRAGTIVVDGHQGILLQR